MATSGRCLNWQLVLCFGASFFTSTARARDMQHTSVLSMPMTGRALQQSVIDFKAVCFGHDSCHAGEFCVLTSCRYGDSCLRFRSALLNATVPV